MQWPSITTTTEANLHVLRAAIHLQNCPSYATHAPQSSRSDIYISGHGDGKVDDSGLRNVPDRHTSLRAGNATHASRKHGMANKLWRKGLCRLWLASTKLIYLSLGRVARIASGFPSISMLLWHFSQNRATPSVTFVELSSVHVSRFPTSISHVPLFLHLRLFSRTRLA